MHSKLDFPRCIDVDTSNWGYSEFEVESTCEVIRKKAAGEPPLNENGMLSHARRRSWSIVRIKAIFLFYISRGNSVE